MNRATVVILVAGLLAFVLAGCSSAPPQPPAAPSQLTLASAPGSVQVTWQEASSGVTSFTVFRWQAGSSGKPGTATKLLTVPGSASGYRDFAVQPSTSYVYAVEATNAAGTSSATTAASGAAPQKATLNVELKDATDQTLMNGTVTRYESSHPSVTVTIALPGSGTPYQTFLDNTVTSSGVDVVEMDVTWPGTYAKDLTDVEAAAGTSVASNYFAYASAAGTVGGKLLAVPWYADVGLLYYRTDLLSKYGYSAPPTTWSQLQTMAQTIQTGEHTAGDPNMWGYAWEGASEDLTCNALEWIASSGGGDIISSSKVITVDNSKAAAALTMAHGWVGTISPSNVATFTPENARALWDIGEAAFMRNWAYAYALTANSTNATVANNFAVAPLPSGSASTTGTGTLGGWMLGIPKASAQPGVAANFILYATSKAEEVHVASDGGFLPSRPDVYTDSSVQSALPFYQVALTALKNAVARPSAVTGANYGQASSDVQTRVGEVLSGSATASAALSQLQTDLVNLTGFSTGSP